MADREIRVVGVFQDGITPKLNKLNRQLLGTLKQFEKLQSKIAPVAQGMESIGEASATLTNNLKGQRGAIEENIRMLRQYRTELGKTATAQKRMGGKLPKPVAPTGPQGTRPSRRPSYTPQPAFIPPRTRGGGGYGAEIGAGVFGMTLGNQLSGIITGAVVSGFQAGARIMTVPFTSGARAIGERIRDEMSDVRTAGGLFSISKRLETPIFENFFEAEEYTKAQNRYLAQLASALPGDTQEYIQISKQISDGIFTIVSQDRENATKLASQLARSRGATAQEIAALTAGGPAAMQQAGKEMVGELTKLTVLAGLGGQQGAYGLPQLTERMLAEEQVSMGMFQRYAAIFRDPMIKGALERNIDEINKAGKNTAARYEAIAKTFREIVTPELVRRYQRTTAGVLEALRTTFLNPEVGLLGLGRPLTASAAKFDEFGERLFKLGKDIVGKNGEKIKKGSLMTAHALRELGYSVNEVAKAATDNLSIFDYLRDIFANLMIVLQPLVNNIVNIFDPLDRLGKVLSGMRERTMQFQKAFEMYRRYLEKEAEGMGKDARATFEATIPFRASLAAINDAMRAYGGYGTDSLKEFRDVAAMLEDPSTTPKQMGEIIKRMLDKFLSSDFAKGIGEALGTVVGTVVSQVGEMMKAAAGLATVSKLAEGFSKGFGDAGGPQGFRDIIRSVFALFGKLLIEVIKAAPLETAIAAALFFLPGAIAGLITTALTGAFAQLASLKLPKLPTKLPGPRAPMAPGPKGGGYFQFTDDIAAAGKNLASGIKNAGALIVNGLKGIVPGIKNAGALIVNGLKGIALNLFKIGLPSAGNLLQGLSAPLKAAGNGFKGFVGMLGKGAKSLGKFGGIATAVVAAFDFFTALFSGKDIWESLGTAAGPVVGTIIGAALTPFFPPLGAAIGSLIGSMKPVQNFFIGLFKGIGEVWGQVWPSIESSLGSFVEIITESWTILGNLVGVFGGLGDNLNAMDVIIIAIKIALQPVVFTFNLLEQALNTIVFAFKALNAAVLWARVGLAELNPKNFFGDSDELKKLKEEAEAANQAVTDQLTKIGDTYKRHNEYHKNLLTVQRNTTNQVTQNTKKLADTMKASGSTFENNKKYTDKAGKSWGWAMMNGEKVMVKWGSVAGESLKKVADGADKAATKLTEYQKKTKRLIAEGKASGLTPTAKDMAWYNNLMNNQNGTTADPNKPSLPSVGDVTVPNADIFISATQTLNTKQDKTNANLTQITTKLSGANSFLAMVTSQVKASKKELKSQIETSSNNIQTKIQDTTNAIKYLPRKLNFSLISIPQTTLPVNTEQIYTPLPQTAPSVNTEQLYIPPTQTTSLVESSTQARATTASNFDVGRVEVTINDNTGDIAKMSDQAAELILQSMYRQARAEVITS